VTLNKPLLILNRGKIVISGGHWQGQISVSITQDYQKPQSQASSQMKSGQSALSDYNSSQFISAEIEAHSSTCTVISSTIDDPNKIISKHAQNQSSSRLGPTVCNPNDQCVLITGSMAGDVIVWKYAPASNTAPQNILQKLKHYHDHDAKVTSIFIHQEMQFFASCSEDGTANMYNLWRLEILRCFQHPELNPLTAVVLSN
jgi:WD40 repeat protein